MVNKALIVFAVEWCVFPRWLPLGLWQICFNYRKLLCEQGVDKCFFLGFARAQGLNILFKSQKTID
jgi:hypothetical protein